MGAGRDRRSEFLCRGDGQRHGIAHLGHWLRWPSFTADSRFPTRRTVQRRVYPRTNRYITISGAQISGGDRGVAPFRRVISANCETGFSDLTPAAYNAGPGRVSAWLTSHRPLPGETRNYVAIVTGWTTDEWASESPPQTADTTIPQGVPCTRLANLISAPKEEAKRIATYIPRWGGLRINVASVMFRLLLLIESLRFCAGLFV